MFAYLWILMIVIAFGIIIGVTIRAIKDVLKNNVNEDDNFLDFLETFSFYHEGLTTFWIVIAITILIALFSLSVAEFATQKGV